MALVLVLSSCAAFIPKEHLISTAQLAGTIQKPFPLHVEKGGVLSITISQPQFVLYPGQNRFGLNGRFLAHAVF